MIFDRKEWARKKPFHSNKENTNEVDSPAEPQPLMSDYGQETETLQTQFSGSCSQNTQDLPLISVSPQQQAASFATYNLETPVMSSGLIEPVPLSQAICDDSRPRSHAHACDQGILNDFPNQSEDGFPVDSTQARPSDSFSFAIGHASMQGRRQKNDDCVRIDARTGIIAVADGIGGAPDGNIASRVACNVAIEAFRQTNNLVDAFRAANSATLQTMHYLGSDKEGAGTTLLLVAYNEAFVDIAFAGDTYAYALKNGNLSQLTANGREGHSNTLTSCVGFDPYAYPHCLRIYCEDFDKLLLCTDGVWGTLPQKELIEYLSLGYNPRDTANEIAQQGADRGTDNATVAVLIKQPSAQ